jgi:hypothetical protein
MLAALASKLRQSPEVRTWTNLHQRLRASCLICVGMAPLENNLREASASDIQKENQRKVSRTLRSDGHGGRSRDDGKSDMESIESKSNPAVRSGGNSGRKRGGGKPAMEPI